VYASELDPQPALSYFAPPAFVDIQWKVYAIFGVFCTVMAIHTFFLLPETSRKMLEDVEEILMTGTPAWKTRVEFNKIVATEHGDVNDKEAAFRHEDVLPEKNTVEVPKYNSSLRSFHRNSTLPQMGGGRHLFSTYDALWVF